MKVHSIELNAKLLRGCALAAHAGPLRRRLTAGPLPLVHPRARGPAPSYQLPLGTAHSAPARMRARSYAPGPDEMRVGSAAHARFERLTCVSRGLPRRFSGSRASNTRGQAPLCPHRRPPRPQHPIVGVCRRGGLHFGHHATSNRDLTTPNRDLAASKRGNCAVRGARLSLAHVEGATKRGELHQ